MFTGKSIWSRYCKLIPKSNIDKHCSIKKHKLMSLRPWWRHRMEKWLVLLALCVGNSPVPAVYPSPSCDPELWCVFIYTWTNGWVNNWDASDLRRHRAQNDVTGILSAIQLFQTYMFVEITFQRYSHLEITTLRMKIQWCILLTNFIDIMIKEQTSIQIRVNYILSELELM